MQSFIETQFPIARLSAESYKERKAGSFQTLAGLGKWWGRKPLILVRAAVLGMLMPSSNNSIKDREIFLKILTMDDTGTWERCKPAVQRKILHSTFDSLPYSERIAFCERPENASGPSLTAWADINAHLNTSARSLSELVLELGRRAFGHTPRVGDGFCGGGSIPFEAARIGCESFGSDLNPVASLLTWASLSLIGGGKEALNEVRNAQERVFAAAEKQIAEWGIDCNERNERAEAFLYCVEVKPEGCDYFIPLAPNWVISERGHIVVVWEKVVGTDRLKPTVKVVSDIELKAYKDKKGATVGNGRIFDPFESGRSWSVEALRGPDGLRRWTNDDVLPRSSDIFQERLYCIRWMNEKGERRYAAPDAGDLVRESKVLQLLRERFTNWQRDGFIPSKVIINGYNTDQPTRERGWTHWHHLFTPRQLLMHGLISSLAHSEHKLCLPDIGRLANADSRLTMWNWRSVAGRGEAISQTFSNQALNTNFCYAGRGLIYLKPIFFDSTANIKATTLEKFGTFQVSCLDARDITETCDLWITDPPYADAVNYHELGDFFLAWYDKQLKKSFPEWIPDARAELAVRGDGDDFRRSMVEIYKNLSQHMPDNGLQMVMFTHQDPAVWADLGMILWAAGLKATAAWTISTETEAIGLKKGNYVQGTVCLVLRKRTANEPGFLDEVYPLVEDEVKHQIASMQALDEGGEPNFNDADYQLAAYAAALKVLTQYATLDGRDVEHEVFADRSRTEKSHFQAVIERALEIACNTLIPSGLDDSWRDLLLVERYYLRALDIESRGERRQGMYEELARGFGVTDIRPLLKSDKANGARMFTPTGLGASLLSAIGETATITENLPARRGRAAASGLHSFAAAPLRHLMFAVRETTLADNSPEPGRQYLRDTFGQAYWGRREGFIGLLEWLAALSNAEGMHEWHSDSEAARILAGRLRNDHA